MRYCPNCGTEVDETAVFCPTCGQPIDQAAQADMPAAPAWPESPAAAGGQPAPPEPAAPGGGSWEDRPPVEREVPPPPAVAPPPTAPVAPPPGARPDLGAAPSAGPTIDLPLTTPVTLSAWLIGGGALLAALGIVIGFFDGGINIIELLLLLALIWIAATVFLSSVLPRVPNAELSTLVIALIGFGMALDRLSGGIAGVGELLLFLGTAAAAIGAILLQLGRDQPLGPTA